MNPRHHAIRTVVVGIPAHDEAPHVVACLQAVLRAADSLPRHVGVIVALAADSCSDGTERLASEVGRTDPRVVVCCGDWRSAGSARAAAIQLGLSVQAGSVSGRVGGPADHETWIATTDADTAVRADWLVRQLRHAERGVEAIAGIVELLDDDDRTDHVAATFDRLYTLGDRDHPHVHGANLGVRADAYAAAGGFADLALAEDHALWNELHRLGRSCMSALDVVVATSARLCSRAPGGFADTIAAAVAAVVTVEMSPA